MIPVQSDNGLESKLFAHFGKAPGYLIIDLIDSKIVSLNFLKRDETVRGIDVVLKNRPDAIITFYIGSGAFYRLNSINIKIYKANKFIIKDLINAYLNKELKEILEPEEGPEHTH